MLKFWGLPGLLDSARGFRHAGRMSLAALLISFLALAVAVVTLPTAFQMWWGRPCLDIQFNTARREGAVVLQILIFNKKIESKLLNILGVYRRDQANIYYVGARIEKSGSREFAGETRLLIDVEDGTPSYRKSLVSVFPATSLVAFHGYGKESAHLVNNKKKADPKPIEPGEYECEVVVHYDDKKCKAQNRLCVGDSYSDTYWSLRKDDSGS